MIHDMIPDMSTYIMDHYIFLVLATSVTILRCSP